ncbi:MAG: hypothetical protein ACI9TY_000844 [Alphaproteobacteria bacterium]|jgi:hypothetical protein
MDRIGITSASLTQTKAYLLETVKQLQNLHNKNNQRNTIEVQSGYRDTIDINILTHVNNSLRQTFLDLQFKLNNQGLTLEVQAYCSRLFISIRST